MLRAIFTPNTFNRNENVQTMKHASIHFTKTLRTYKCGCNILLFMDYYRCLFKYSVGVESTSSLSAAIYLLVRWFLCIFQFMHDFPRGFNVVRSASRCECLLMRAHDLLIKILTSNAILFSL